MPRRVLSVAIPVRDGMPLLAEVLDAVRAQRVDADLELLVADSRSIDGSREAAEAAGARVLDVPPGTFSHGGTRRRLLEAARGEHVALLTQDATPAGPDWLATLDAALIETGAGIACGPYLPRPDTSVMVRRELEAFFAAVAAAGAASPAPGSAPAAAGGGSPPAGRGPVGDVAPVRAAAAPAAVLLHPVPHGAAGPAAFHTDANAIVARWAAERVPFADVAYAEDQALARAMDAAGVRRAFVPSAAVHHSHDLPAGARLRRWFDEFRALHEVHGWRADAHAHRVLGDLRAQIRADRAFARRTGRADGAGLVAASLAYHAERRVAAVAGSRADRLPAGLRRRISADRRA